jgi:hypothetical protein
MDSYYSDLNLRTLMELKRMRDEALELYDYCLAEGNIGPLQQFIEEQLALDPPPLLLLYEIADDIRLRVLTLREHYYDVRNQVVHVLRDMFHIDVGQIIPSDADIKTHPIDETTIMAILQSNGTQINDEERILLVELFQQAGQTASQLQQDIQITQTLQDMVLDWITAFAALSAREYLDDYHSQPRKLH